ncbi:MAG: hypothetical protein QM664_07225 [Flavihumibacter sp.]
MLTGLVHLHSLLRWLILIFLVIAIIRHLNGLKDKNAYTAKDRKTDLLLMIFTHTNLLVGLILWFAGPMGLKNISNLGMGEVMRTAVYRFFAVEHVFGMLVAVVLITIARSAGKPATAGTAAHKKAFYLLLVALLIILATIPWPFREAIARSLFPGM